MAGNHIIKKALCILTALLAAAAAIMPDALAFDETSNQTQQSRLEQENQKKQNELQKTELSITEKEAYSQQLQKKIADLSQKIQQSNNTIKELNKQINEKQVLIDAKTAQIDDKLEVLKERLRAIYTAGDISTLEIILQARDFSDYIDKMELVSSITESDNKLIRTLQDEMDVITDDQNKLKEAKAKVEKEKQELEKSKKQVNDLSAENTRIIAELIKKKDNKSAELEDIQSRQQELERAMETYYAEQAAKKSADTAANKTTTNKAKSSTQNNTSNTQKKESSTQETSQNNTSKPAGRQNNQNNTQNNQNSETSTQNSSYQNDNPSENDSDNTGSQNNDTNSYIDTSGRFVWPCPGHTYLTSLFEEWRGASNHGALDIADGSVYGASVIACQSGTVMYTNEYCPHDYGKFESCGCGGGYGKYVMIDHGNGKMSIYGHLSDVVAYPGQQVSAGQLIGYVGSTGYSTGPHLHFELRKDGVRYDPLSEYDSIY